MKTPLAVLAQEAQRAAGAGQTDLADAIGQQVERMRPDGLPPGARPGRRFRRDARGALLGGGVRGGTVPQLLRLYAHRGLTIDVAVSPDHSFRGQREDLDEMLGNLPANACKWATSRVTIRSSAEGAAMAITIDHDGPGRDPSLRDRVLQRGVRADEAGPGSGFGLAIVRDLAQLYGGSISLSSAPDSGVRASLKLPAAPRVGCSASDQ